MRTTSSPVVTFGLNVSMYRYPETLVPAWFGGVIVTLIVPDAPAASTRGLNVLVPKVRSAHRSPLLAETAESNGCMCASAAAAIGAGDAPAGPKGPARAGEGAQAPTSPSA